MNYYNLTNPQKSIWLTEKFYQGTSINTICGCFHINNTVDFDILKKAINEVIKTNDAMRLMVSSKNNDCIQYISDYVHFDIEMVDLPTEKDIEKTASKFANIPFFSENQFLFKFLLFKLPNNSGGFFLNVHHLIGDSWSLGLIAKEVARIYSELLSGCYQSQLQPSYINYIKTENDYKNSDKFIKDKAYWDEIFKTIPEIASISSAPDKQKNEISCNGNRKKFMLDENKLADIKAFCDKYRISIYNFFMAVYSLYVSRVTSLDDFVIGTPVLNRTNFEQKHTMGMFISIAPLRINLNSENSFVDFAKKIAVDTTSIFRHQKYSYQSIIEDIRKRDASIPTLYNIVLSYQITKTIEESNNINYTTDWIFNGNSGDELEIHLFDLNDENSMTIAYDYKQDKLTETEVDNLHNRVLSIIDQVIVNNNILLNDLEIITPEEKNKILNDFNSTFVDYPRNKTIVDLFEEQVQKTPDNIAVIFENQQLTYKELNEKANQLARVLVQNNVKIGDIVGIYLNKSLEVVVSMFAILKAGAAFLPLDLDYPEDRLNYIISNSSPKVIFSSKNVECSINAPTILVDLSEEFYKNQDSTNLGLTISPEDLMYVMYTSGSTGNPKGVMVKHKNIIRLAAFPNFIEFSKNEVMVQTGTIVFDACIFEIFGSLLHGFKLYILKKENILDIPYFTNFLKEKNVSILFLTTGLFNQLGIQNPSMFSNLKYLLTGGDVISKASIQKIRNCAPNLKIINCYGPTENGSYSTCYHVIGNEEIIPIGKPITNSTAYVVSNNLLCPIGVPGELWVGGDGIARGYINNEDLTKEQFIENPFGEGMIYKTGDLVKWLPDGNIAFLGRIDNQVKVRGFRIELSEIDRKLLAVNNIKQALTVVKNINNNKTICSYIISDEEIDIKNLKGILSKHLPPYMVPTFIMQLKEFPLNINGKVDIKALPTPSIDNSKREIIKTRNNIDKAIITILEELLNINNISINDSFFDLGGDSLSAISFTNTISHKLNVTVTVSNVFNYPIIKDLSDYISSLTKIDETSIKPAPKMDYYPASNAQKRIYYASIMDDNSILYNVSGGIIVDKPLDINLLKNCFKTLIERHEILRTHFSVIENDIVQIIDNTIDFNLKVEKTDSEDLNNIYSNFVKPFDLSKAPLFRSKIIELKNNQMLLLLDMHHIISDGTSLSILLQELCDLYNGNTLPEKQLDYKDFTLWEKEEFEKEPFKQSKDFWVNQYKDEIPLLNMPTTYARPSVQSFEGANYYTMLSKEVFEKVNEVSKNLGITPYMLMLSAFYILLSKYSSQDDIVVGTPIVGRELPELSNMLGMFVNTLALRNKVDHSSNFDNFANSIKEYCLSAFQNQTYPFDELVKELNVKRDTSRNPLFDIMFIYQNNGYPEIKFKGTSSKYFIPDNNISKFDLSLEVIPIDNEYSLRFEYCTKLFDEDFIKRLASHYINILNAILGNSKIKIADIDMLSEEERKQILYKFNDVKLDIPVNYNLIDLFNKIVKSYPQNIAISNMANQLTYAELDMKSNYLANKLYSKGIRNNDIVGVCLNRSIELLVSIWAILKLGASYMPMYIGYPSDRLNYMLTNSKAKILITNSHLDSLFGDFNKIVIDSVDTIKNLENFNVDYNISPDNNAYIIYTSGTTGKPKGVKVSHKNLINFIYSFNKYYNGISPKDSFLASTNISFDVSIWELFLPLLNGAKLVLNSEEILTNIIDYCNIISYEEITTLYIPPNILNEVYELLKDNSNIKINKLLVGVESIKKETLNKFFDINNNMIIVNGYGPTETTICATALVYKKDLNNINSFVSIGHPLYNNKIYILNNNLKHQPIGIPGEIYIGGFGVGNGYIDNPKANENFVKIDNQIFYKSGDLASWNKDGTINFIGRTDNQIKLNGYRIELNEINSVLMSYPKINKCYTTVITEKNNSYLVSYFTSDSNIITNDLNLFLQAKLTFYMVPRFLIQIDEFPITVNGKINYQELPKPAYKTDVSYVPPRDTFEKKIANILCNLLNLDKISIDDNFFNIGCDSVIAIKFQVEALKKNIDINYGDIFNYPSIRLLSENKNNIKKDNEFIIDKSYDYTRINHLLTDNRLNKNCVSKKNKHNSVLLLGSTGFLGSHILDSYFSNNTNNTIYCIIRRKGLSTSPSERLKKTLNYYFGAKYDNYIDKNKIIVIEGDISQKNFGLSVENLNLLMDNIDIVINSAALVKHYGNTKTFSQINIDGTKTIIDVCKKYNKKFYHISTLSISGMGLPNINSKSLKLEKCVFDETSFFINQHLDNVYLYTKFEAEKNILEAILDGLDATILRIGNLTNRFSDGFFQINVSENGFVNKLKAIINLQIIQDSFLNHSIELTPVDLCANAIIKIVNSVHDFSILHIFNNNIIKCKEILNYMNNLGYHIEAVSDKEFADRIIHYLKTDALKNSITGIITDLNKEKILDYTSNVIINADISNSFLKTLGFSWPVLDEIYFKKYFDYFNNINYFSNSMED